MITRYLRHSGYDVQYVRNITDIDDKILRRADENGEVYSDLTKRMINASIDILDVPVVNVFFWLFFTR